MNINDDFTKYFTIIDDMVLNTDIDKNNSVYNKNNLCNYKYSLSSYREFIKKIVYKESVEINDNIIDKYLINKMNIEYMPYIRNKICDIDKIPVVEQKTPEWFKLRETMISASDAGYFLKKCGNAKALESLKIKLGLKQYVNSNCPPLMHGNTYEDVARAIYESRNKVKVFEYGILPSPATYIGASPDGIVVECLDNSFNCQSKFGRLLEIKNPYSREIDNSVKPEYMVQILQQQYTTGMPICDFLETTIVDKYCRTDLSNHKAYKTLNDMLNDKLDIINNMKRVKNNNIPPENLNKFGNEKGLIIWYQQYISNNDIRNKYVLYPLQNKYDITSIEKWIIDTNLLYNIWCFKEVKYWRLDVYSEKTIIYDQETYETEYIPILCNVWNIITQCKEIMRKSNGDCSNINLFIEDLEYNNKTDNPFYNEKKDIKKQKQSPKSPKSPKSRKSPKSCDNNNNNNDNNDNNDNDEKIELDF